MPKFEELVIGQSTVELHVDGLTVTRYADGTSVPACAHDTAEYLERARAHGYGDDVAAMSREHEIAHTVLAFVLTGKPSATLWRVAHRETDAIADGIEEAAIMTFQRLTRTLGLSMIDLANRIGHSGVGEAMHREGGA